MVRIDVSLTSILLAVSLFQIVTAEVDVTETARSIRSHGFEAEDIFLPVENGNRIVNLVRAWNPLIKPEASQGKRPLLFVHGVITNANGFIVNDEDVRPKDLSNYKPDEMSLEDLIELLEDEPSAKSLAYLAMNFGYTVWLMNRAPTTYARSYRGVGSPTTPISVVASAVGAVADTVYSLEPRLDFRPPIDIFSLVFPENTTFWDFGFDPQAKSDFPETVDYVLSHSGHSKLHVVTHSAGGTVLLTSLIVNPQLADKILSSLLWAPAFDLGPNEMDPLAILYQILTDPYYDSHIGSFPPDAIVIPLQDGIDAVCNVKLTEATVCSSVSSLIFGYGGEQQMLGNVARGPRAVDTATTPEMAQLSYSLKTGRFHYRDYLSSEENIRAYGTSEPPLYDPTKILLENMHFYSGLNDRLVQPNTLELLLKRLKVAYSYEEIGNATIHWNHISFLIHKKIAELLIIPGLRIISAFN